MDDCTEALDKLNSVNKSDQVSMKKHGMCRKEDNGGGEDSQFHDPVFKKLALFNGQVNKLTKDEIKAKLIELRLDPRGHKDVLKKRLKNYYKRKQLARVSTASSMPRKAHCDYFVVIDFEATCEQNASRYPHEIIEFPAVLVNASDGTVIDEFHSMVRPTQNPTLSEYCTQLTSITQEQVDSAPAFVDVLKRMEVWLASHQYGKGKKFAIVTDGPWDMSRFMFLQCRTSRIPFPRWATRWVNIRKSYSNSYKIPRVNVLTMLDYLGLSFEGRQHCGLDDARNIARILGYMINDGCSIYINERMYDAKLALIAASVGSELDPEVVCVGQDEADAELDPESADEDGVERSTAITSDSVEVSRTATSGESDGNVEDSNVRSIGSTVSGRVVSTSCDLNCIPEIDRGVAELNL